MKVIGVIPARWASSRFEGKVLADVNGLPMVQRVWMAAKLSSVLEEVFIACDDEKVFDLAQEFGAKVLMTSKELSSGTERIARAFRYTDANIIINIQADEPLIEPPVIDALAKALIDDAECQVATMIKKIEQEADLTNPNVVKVVVDHNKNALYFSRAAIPFNRENRSFDDCTYFKHLGLYGYRREFLTKFKELSDSILENVEKLEQLKFLEFGIKVKTVETDYETMGVDTPEDLEKVVEILKARVANA